MFLKCSIPLQKDPESGCRDEYGNLHATLGKGGTVIFRQDLPESRFVVNLRDLQDLVTVLESVEDSNGD